MGIEDEYMDVLQNIESQIVSACRRFVRAVDFDVMRALESVIDSYQAEGAGRAPRDFRLSAEEAAIFASVRAICDWRLGRLKLDVELETEWDSRTGDDSSPKDPAGAVDKPDDLDGSHIKSREEIILCLKRVLKSVKYWNGMQGRTGYLDFISQHL